jgi:hypothetical protein
MGASSSIPLFVSTNISKEQGANDKELFYHAAQRFSCGPDFSQSTREMV